jgi:hypothetical protein
MINDNFGESLSVGNIVVFYHAYFGLVICTVLSMKQIKSYNCDGSIASRVTIRLRSQEGRDFLTYSTKRLMLVCKSPELYSK